VSIVNQLMGLRERERTYLVLRWLGGHLTDDHRAKTAGRAARSNQIDPPVAERREIYVRTTTRTDHRRVRAP